VLPVGGAAFRTFAPGVKNPHGTTVAMPSHYPLPSLPFYFRLFSLPSHLFPHPLSVPKLEFGVSDLEKNCNLTCLRVLFVRLATELRTVELHDSSESSSAAEYTTSEKLSSQAARIDSTPPPQRPVDILEIISDLAGHPKASKGETWAIFYRPIVFLSPNEQCQGTDRAPRVPLGFKNASVL